MMKIIYHDPCCCGHVMPEKATMCHVMTRRGDDPCLQFVKIRLKIAELMKLKPFKYGVL